MGSRRVDRDEAAGCLPGLQIHRIGDDDCVKLKGMRCSRRQEIDRSRFSVQMVRFHVHHAFTFRILQLRKVRMDEGCLARLIGVYVE